MDGRFCTQMLTVEVEVKPGGRPSTILGCTKLHSFRSPSERKYEQQEVQRGSASPKTREVEEMIVASRILT